MIASDVRMMQRHECPVRCLYDLRRCIALHVKESVVIAAIGGHIPRAIDEHAGGASTAARHCKDADSPAGETPCRVRGAYPWVN